MQVAFLHVGQNEVPGLRIAAYLTVGDWKISIGECSARSAHRLVTSLERSLPQKKPEGWMNRIKEALLGIRGGR